MGIELFQHPINPNWFILVHDHKNEFIEKIIKIRKWAIESNIKIGSMIDNSIDYKHTNYKHRNGRGGYIDWVIKFENTKDATLFKLTWM